MLGAKNKKRKEAGVNSRLFLSLSLREREENLNIAFSEWVKDSVRELGRWLAKKFEAKVSFEKFCRQNMPMLG